jgi:hypothetical protein
MNDKLNEKGVSTIDVSIMMSENPKMAFDDAVYSVQLKTIDENFSEYTWYDPQSETGIRGVSQKDIEAGIKGGTKLTAQQEQYLSLSGYLKAVRSGVIPQEIVSENVIDGKPRLASIASGAAAYILREKAGLDKKNTEEALADLKEKGVLRDFNVEKIRVYGENKKLSETFSAEQRSLVGVVERYDDAIVRLQGQRQTEETRSGIALLKKQRAEKIAIIDKDRDLTQYMRNMAFLEERQQRIK